MIISKIVVYPIKSLDGAEVTRARITEGGILEHDRVYAIVDEAGSWVNAKRTAQAQLLRCAYEPGFQEVTLWRQGAQEARHSFSLVEQEALNRWLSDFFGFTVRLSTEKRKGYPDDTVADGPTVISEASMHAVAGWFPGLDIENVRRRFRSNLEVAAEAPFWEDRLFGAPGELRPFRIGDVNFLGHSPCQRCVVPTRDPVNAEPMRGFQKQFMEMREKSLPQWARVEHFNHYYRFATNTSVPESEAGKWVQLGDEVTGEFQGIN